MTELFETCRATVYHYCRRRCASRAIAEDLTSTVFLEVWRSRERAVAVAKSILPWVYGIAANVCRSHHRSQRRHRAALSRLQLPDAEAVGSPDEVVTRLDDRRRVAAALQRLAELPQDQQDVFALTCWQGLSYADAARALTIPVGTVRSRLARARRALRQQDD